MRIQPAVSLLNARRRQRQPVALPRRPHWLLQRKVLLTLAAAILLACAVRRPLGFILLVRSRNLVALVIAGFVVAALVRELATVCLRSKGRPWHTRWFAPLLVVLALAGINALLPAADRLAFAVFGIGPLLTSEMVAQVLIALQLMWIAVLR